MRSPSPTSGVAHVSAKRGGAVPGTGGATPADEVFRCGKCPKFQKISKGQGLCPRTPGSTPCSWCAAPRWRARKKKRTPSGDGMESACHVWVFRAKREKIFEALFGVTLHHLNLDPASSPEALMPGQRPNRYDHRALPKAAARAAGQGDAAGAHGRGLTKEEPALLHSRAAG